jgi:translocation and assembly module TamB
MTKTHTPHPLAASRRDWVRGLARVLCGALGIAGVLPFAIALVLHSAWARGWATGETERALRSRGIVARYEMALRVWPLAVELADVHVASSDGGGDALACNRLRVRPKLFALLAGKLVIDEIEVDSPVVRAVVRNGVVTNLPKLQSQPSAPSQGGHRAPFGALAVTEASVDLDVDSVHLTASSIDLDVTSGDETEDGSTFETALRVGHASLHRARARSDGTVATDDDTLCSLEGRVSIRPRTVLVRRLDGTGVADFDAAPETTPPCDLPADDKRRVELSLAHVHAVLPQDGEGAALPAVDGRVGLRVPIALATRLVDLPETDGWIRLDADVRYGPGSILPDLTGTLEAHDVRLAQYTIADEIRSELRIRNNLVQSPVTTLRLAGGTITLSDTVVDPLARGVKLEKTRLDASAVDFTALLRALGVHPNAHVAWDLRELHLPVVTGTFAPLALDGDFSARTFAFGVYDRPAEDPARERLFGFSEAQIGSHIGVRSDAFTFTDLHAVLPHSHIDGGSVSLGFHNDLRVDAPSVFADLDDLSPIGPVVLHGQLQAAARVRGTFVRPEPEGDIKAIAGFVVSDVAFGDVSAGHVTVDVHKPEIAITGLKAQRRDSAYEVPSARLSFGGPRGFIVDAVGSSPALRLRDLLSMFALDDDPRFEGLQASMAMRADVHVALGGPEDACGNGYVSVDAKGRLDDVLLYGERFAQGEADGSLRWYDRQQGIAGAEIDVRSFVLEKIRSSTGPDAATKGKATGTILGSAAVRRGGALTANVVVEGVPLSSLDALGRVAHGVEGRISGVAHVSGDLDTFHNDPGLVASAELDVSDTRARGVVLPASHLDLRVTHHLEPEKRSLGRTRCGASVGAPFDRATYAADTASHGEWTFGGELLGGTVRAQHVVVTRAKSPVISGRVSLRGLDLGPLARIFGDQAAAADDAIADPAASAVNGQLWGELIADQIFLDHPSKSRVLFFLGPTVVSRGGQKLLLQPPREPIALADDTITLPALRLTLDTPDGFRGGFVLTGEITRAMTDPTLALEARLDPVDLAVLQHIVPKVDGADGKVVGSVRVTGRVLSPAVAGELHVTGDSFEVHGLSSAITAFHLDVKATATDLSLSGAGKFAGGTVDVDGTLPIRGFDLGRFEGHVVAQDIRLAPADGITAMFDANLAVTYEAKGRGDGSTLPHVAGDIVVSSFHYARPIALTTDLTRLGTRAKRTEVDTYDPALDFATFDLHLRSRAPIVIKNNLVEVELAIDTGTLDITGTNQRIGLRGALRTLPGGLFHFQQSDFEVRQGRIRFDDPTRVDPNVDVTAVTEYRRYTDTGPSAAAGVETGGGLTAASTGSTRGGSLWRITLHAYGDADNLRVDMTSEPTLSQEDIVLLLAVGMTRSELDQLQASSLGASLALNYLGATSGADRAVKQVLPIIDDFRFGSAYSTVTGKTEPQLTVGKRLSNDLRASVTAGLSEDRELRSNIEWRLSNRLSLQGSYDNINDVSSSALGNLGVDLRWRLEFE